MNCLSKLGSCFDCVADACWWAFSKVTGSTCVASKVDLKGTSWNAIVPPGDTLFCETYYPSATTVCGHILGYT